MSEQPLRSQRSQHAVRAPIVEVLQAPGSGVPLRLVGDQLVSPDGQERYCLTLAGIPLFAEHLLSEAGRIQQAHYDAVAAQYLENLTYPHTQEYMRYLDARLFAVLPPGSLGTTAELCCGHAEAFRLLGDRITLGIGIDVSMAMLEVARRTLPEDRFFFAQGDATMLPLRSQSFDTVIMLGGIHHVPDRHALFTEVQRILKPGGFFYFREPVDDFPLWRGIRRLVYRWSPALDHTTERPLRYGDTVPVLESLGLRCLAWHTAGLLGFCVFMNSDILVFNRLFRFLPGIRTITRMATWVDDWMLRLPGLTRWGLQVIGVGQKLPAG